LINGIFPNINADLARRNACNSSDFLNTKHSTKHYRDIPATNALRPVLIAIGDEFDELRSAMQ
jgi:hypothetical protein